MPVDPEDLAHYREHRDCIICRQRNAPLVEHRATLDLRSYCFEGPVVDLTVFVCENCLRSVDGGAFSQRRIPTGISLSHIRRRST